ncbi:MAG: hypothetical protein GXP49_14950 [Deltaproteobacteria bacterium]|nr:hypothetical protein [Deltaproteobacteria bacterium]
MIWKHEDRPKSTIQCTSGKTIQIITAKNKPDLGKTTAPIFADLLGPCARPWEIPPGDEIKSPVIALSSAPGLMPIFDELIGYYLEGWLSFEKIWAVSLAELEGMSEKDPLGFRHRLVWGLLYPVDFPASNLLWPETASNSLEEAATALSKSFSEIGDKLDLALIEVEPGGRVGLNEPGTAWEPGWITTGLSQELRTSLAAKSGGNDSSVPSRGMTAGIGLLSGARNVLVACTGSDGGNVLRQALLDEPGVHMPLSFLQEAQGECIIIMDQEAANQLHRA